MAIHKALAEVMREISELGIGKTRTNEQQGYKFRGVDDVMNVFGPVLAKHGVFIVPEFSDWRMDERTSSRGGALFDVRVQGKFTFTHEDGDSLTVGPFYGEAMDNSDKATNKAMAVAFKYCMFQTFCVPLESVTGGDADAVSHEVAHSSKVWLDQVSAVQDKAEYDALKERMMEAYGSKPPADVRKAFSAVYKLLELPKTEAPNANAA